MSVTPLSLNPEDLSVRSLGEPRFESPMLHYAPAAGISMPFVEEGARVLHRIGQGPGEPAGAPLSFEAAGGRDRIFFDPERTTAAIVTCGGLCPGLNDVIRALVMNLHYWYGVRRVWGIRYGYAGLVPGTETPPIPLDPELVSDIHKVGGTMLGSSRGNQDVGRMVDMLMGLGVNILFTIGGDGTLRGAHEIAEEALRRGLNLAVVGIPKTIDNDIELIYRSFGFETAVSEAAQVIDCAHTESKGSRHGVGLVKLMGRDSGFVAAYAALASGDVNFCLVPEVPFKLEGERGLLAHLRERLRRRGHAVITVAEGAGTHLLGTGELDASGNRLHKDIGVYLKERIEEAFAAWGDEVHIKYFDPSYSIRSVRACSSDSIFCSDLARYAVHAGMAGKTDLMIGLWHGLFTHVPLRAIAGRRKKIDPRHGVWLGVLASTGQPSVWE